jgi:hypothetical protein
MPGMSNFLDVQVANTTDTVAVRAQFPNPEGLLIPGGVVGVTTERGAPKAEPFRMCQSGSFAGCFDFAECCWSCRRAASAASHSRWLMTAVTVTLSCTVLRLIGSTGSPRGPLRGVGRGARRPSSADSNRSPRKRNRSLHGSRSKFRILKIHRAETGRGIRGLRPESLKISRRRPDSCPLTSGNVGGFVSTRNPRGETLVAGWVARIRTATCRIRTGLSNGGARTCEQAIMGAWG